MRTKIKTHRPVMEKLPHHYTQKRIIRIHLENGQTISALQAIINWRIMRLSHIIYEFRREGMPISSTRIQTKSGKFYVIYKLEKSNQ